MPISVFAYQHGIYPRSERVVVATRGQDRGRVGAEAVEAAFAQDLQGYIQTQQRAGLDFFSDGLLRWQDIFRPLAEAAGTASPHALVRWFDTNTFFRAPELGTAPRPISALPAVLPDASLPKPRVATLPSPFMFSRAARTEQDRNRLMVDLAGKVLKPVVDSMVKAGAGVIHLEEPWLTYVGIGTEDWAPFGDAIQALRPATATIVLHTYFGDAGPHLDRLRRLPVDAIGVDLIETDLSSLEGVDDKDLVLGALNGRSSIVEPLDTLIAVTRRVAERIRPRNLYLSSNCELGYLPTTIAEKKVARLGEAAAHLKELVSV